MPSDPNDRMRNTALRMLALCVMGEATVDEVAVDFHKDGSMRYRLDVIEHATETAEDLDGASAGKKFQLRFEHAERMAEYWSREMERLRPK